MEPPVTLLAMTPPAQRGAFEPGPALVGRPWRRIGGRPGGRVSAGLAAFCAACSLVGACQTAAEGEAGESVPSATDSTAPSDALEADTTLDPQATLVIALRSVPRDLDPAAALTPWGARIVEDLLFEGLVRRSEQQHPWAVPALADRCQTDSPFQIREIVCHLRPGAQFHDGSAVTPDDVVYSIELWLGPRMATTRMEWGLHDLEQVDIVEGPGVDARTSATGSWIRVRFTRPDPLALERLSAIKIVPRSKHRGRAHAFGRAPVGSGPMRVASMSPDRIVLERVPGRSTPLARLVLRAVTDGAATLTLLRRGDVHIAPEISPIHLPHELAKPGTAPRFRAYVLTPPVFDLLLYNLRREPQSNPRMRDALDAAIPRAELAETAHGGLGLEVTAPVDLQPPHEIDLERLSTTSKPTMADITGLPLVERTDDEAALPRAADLLDQLGWPMDRGLRRRTTGHLRLVLMWNGASGDGTATARLLREGWRKAGIHVPYATASWSYLRGPLSRGDFDVAMVRLAQYGDQDLYRYFHSRGDLNFSGVADPRLDEALEAYRRSRTQAERRRAQALVAARLTDVKPISILHAPVEVMVVSRQVVGLEFVDDLPRLGALGLLPPNQGGWGPPAP